MSDSKLEKTLEELIKEKQDVKQKKIGMAVFTGLCGGLTGLGAWMFVGALKLISECKDSFCMINAITITTSVVSMFAGAYGAYVGVEEYRKFAREYNGYERLINAYKKE